MPIGRISKRSIDAFACPLGKDRAFLWDDVTTGFGLCALASGVKTYLVQYSQGGRRRRATIGRHGRLTPEQARIEAKRLLGDATRGIDVIAARAAARAVPSFRAAAQAYLQKHVGPLRKARTLRGYEALPGLHVIPALGATRVTEIRRAHVAAMHRQISKKGAANRALSLTSAIMNFAAREYAGLGLAPNPTKGVARYPEKGRERFLSDAELGRLGRALRRAETIGLAWTPDLTKPGSKHAPRPENRVRTIDPYAIAAIRLLIFTGARL